jgi:hypothetical protein
MMRPLRDMIDRLLPRGGFSANTKLRGMCKPQHDPCDWLWTFLHDQGIGPTNNASERATVTTSVLVEASLWPGKPRGQPVRGVTSHRGENLPTSTVTPLHPFSPRCEGVCTRPIKVM